MASVSLSPSILQEPLNANSELIRNFWSVLHSFNEVEKK